MSRFFMAYHLSGTTSANASQNHALMQEWRLWMQKHAEYLLEPQNPFTKCKDISANGVCDKEKGAPFMGYSVINADSWDIAEKVVQDCPFLKMGHIELAEIADMPTLN